MHIVDDSSIMETHHAGVIIHSCMLCKTGLLLHSDMANLNYGYNCLRSS